MARGIDAFQKEELVLFLEELYRLGGYESQAQWARDADYHPVSLSNALNRNNTDGLDGHSLYRLMRSAGRRAGMTPAEVLTHQRPEAVDPGPAWRPLLDRLEELGKTLAVAAARVEDAADRMNSAGG